MCPEPMIRARAGQDAFAYVERVDPDGARKMRDRVPPESWEILSTAHKTAWVSIEHDHHLSDAWIPVFGEERSVELIAGSVLVILESPVLRSLIQGALRLLGTTPASLVKVIPRAARQIYRDFHTARVGETGPDSAVLHFDDIAPEVLVHPSYMFVWRGTFRAIFELCRCEGRAELELDEKTRCATWTLRWKPIEQ